MLRIHTLWRRWWVMGETARPAVLAQRETPPGMAQPGARLSGGCPICRHPARDTIDYDIIHGVTLNALKTQYGHSTKTWIRHRNQHLLKRMAEVFALHLLEDDPQGLGPQFAQIIMQPVGDLVLPEDMTMLERIDYLSNQALQILNGALNANNRGIAVKAIREARECLRMRAAMIIEIRKLEADLPPPPTETDKAWEIAGQRIYGLSPGEGGAVCPTCGLPTPGHPLSEQDTHATQ